MTTRLPKASVGTSSPSLAGSLHHQRQRSSTASGLDDLRSPPISSIADPSDERYTLRDPMVLYMLFNLSSMRAMLILVSMLMLFNLISMRAILLLVFLFILFNLDRVILILVYPIL